MYYVLSQATAKLQIYVFTRVENQLVYFLFMNVVFLLNYTVYSNTDAGKEFMLLWLCGPLIIQILKTWRSV